MNVLNPPGDVSRAMTIVMGVCGRSPEESLFRDRCKERLVEETGKANERLRLRQRKKAKGGTPESKAGVGQNGRKCPSDLEESVKHF